MNEAEFRRMCQSGDSRNEAAFRKVLSEWGIEGNMGELHSWRCAYPDRYGSCDCVDSFIADLVAAAGYAEGT